MKPISFRTRVIPTVLDDVGIPFARQPNNTEPMVADVEYARLLMEVVKRPARAKKTQAQILKGVVETWRIDRAYKGMLGDAMAACPA